jgi:inosine/xanthosine triphosphate pyrophosphatase family protein
MRDIDFSKFKLVSSNAKKLEEYRRFGVIGLQVETGVDLAEVDGTPIEVVLHKAKAAGAGRIVEDSVMIVGGETFVDARWRLEAIHEWFGKPAVWEVNLGVNDGEDIAVFTGRVEGEMRPAKGEGWDYDPYFYVQAEDKTLAELAQLGRKDEFSARHGAVRRLID